MQFKTITHQKLPFFVALGLLTVLTSCGSFQYAGYDNDGIYASDEYETEVEQPVVTTSTSGSNYYKNYFAENSAEVDAIQEESEIFTDIDSYEGNYVETEQDTLEQRPAYGGWGQSNSTVTINIIDNGWYGWNDPWLWNAGWGYGWNNWGWGRPWGYNRWGYGWNNPWAWNAGFGIGWNYGWGGWNAWNPYGYNNWAWNNGFYSNSNRYAYNGSRRGSSLIYNDNLGRVGRSNAAVSRRDYSTSRLSNSNTSTRRNRNVRSVNSNSRTIRSTQPTRTSRTIRNSSSTRRVNTRTTRPSSTRSSGTIRRSSGSTRSSSGSVRSSSSSRSSGSVRSSGSSRSSSGRSSSGGARRGRG